MFIVVINGNGFNTKVNNVKTQEEKARKNYSELQLKVKKNTTA